uniref:Uncharacterized protein n=1 Tax=Plectus sambesii TaxID=2011161 RepID=A0A914VN86_9BILA
AKETTREGESSAARKRETRLATELLGRLYDHAANSEIIGRLLLGAKQWCESGVAEQLLLVPENQCFSSPSGPLETTLVVPGAQCVAAVVHSVEFGATVTVDAASTLRLWNLSADSVVHTAKIGERYSYRGGYTLQDAIVISNDH